MDLRESATEAAFREEVRSWFEENLPPGWGADFREPTEMGARVAFLREWQGKLHAGGWMGLDWPVEYGGRGAGVMEQLIYNEEAVRARAPNLINLSVGTSLTGPTLIACGAQWQKERFLEPILTGQDVWCQGFSEPGAGSDLAGIRTRGEVVDDAIVVTGQKTWTSFARYADWCILLVRTDPDAGRHGGLTFLLLDMNTPGIEIRPLREMTGESWFNEVFFDEVRVPLSHVVGGIGQGWQIAMTTLAHERGSSAQHALLERDLEAMMTLASRRLRNGKAASEDPVIRQKLASFAASVMILRMTAYRNVSSLERDGVPGPEGSTLKLFWSELDQEVKSAAVEILGLDGLVPDGDAACVDDGYWAHELLWSRAATIYAGTSEVQRNIIAQRVLGLPR